MRILIKNGRLIDPAHNIDDTQDILIEDSKISRLSKGIQVKAQKLIDAHDKIVMPGLLDLHVHLRQPGREDKETVASGTYAAAKGGVTSVLAMPNTSPAIDCLESVRLLKDIIQQSARVNIFIAGCITKARQGKELTDMAKLKKKGVLAISDDGSSVDNDKLMLEAFKKAKQNNLLVICHCEDKSLSKNGAVNLGFTSTRLGLRGISKESEFKRVARDIQLAGQVKASVHIAHVSCQESIELIAQAKKKGIRVTAETCPHYLSLSEEDVLGFDTNRKVNPPLRSRDDVSAIRQGLKDGVVDAISSDHAPHTENEKEVEFERAEFGTIGLETELAVCITELVHTGLLDWLELSKKMSLNPARILKVDRGSLQPGGVADIIVVDPHKEWLVEKESFVSKSKNSGFLGRKLKGVVECTICAGKIVFEV